MHNFSNCLNINKLCFSYLFVISFFGNQMVALFSNHFHMASNFIWWRAKKEKEEIACSLRKRYANRNKRRHRNEMLFNCINLILETIMNIIIHSTRE